MDALHSGDELGRIGGVGVGGRDQVEILLGVFGGDAVGESGGNQARKGRGGDEDDREEAHGKIGGYSARAILSMMKW